LIDQIKDELKNKNGDYNQNDDSDFESEYQDEKSKMND